MVETYICSEESGPKSLSKFIVHGAQILSPCSNHNYCRLHAVGSIYESLGQTIISSVKKTKKTKSFVENLAELFINTANPSWLYF